MFDISDKAKEMYAQMSSELRTLNQVWRYVHDLTHDLFASDTFNRASAPFFGTVLTALFSYGLTLLARLMDPAMTGKRDNCSLEAMAAAIEHRELLDALRIIRTDAEELLAYRNKQIAHLDRITTLDDDPPQLFTWVKMAETVAALGRWMNAFERSSGLPVEGYDVDERWGDADEVRDLLRKGLAARR